MYLMMCSSGHVVVNQTSPAVTPSRRAGNRTRAAVLKPDLEHCNPGPFIQMHAAAPRRIREFPEIFRIFC